MKTGQSIAANHRAKKDALWLLGQDSKRNSAQITLPEEPRAQGKTKRPD
jgi:hypothetical protein